MDQAFGLKRWGRLLSLRLRRLVHFWHSRRLARSLRSKELNWEITSASIPEMSCRSTGCLTENDSGKMRNLILLLLPVLMTASALSSQAVGRSPEEMKQLLRECVDDQKRAPGIVVGLIDQH